MEIKELTQLIDAVSKAEIKNFHLQTGDFCLTMDKLSESKVNTATAVKEEVIMHTNVQKATEVVEKAVVLKEEKEENTMTVNSPIVGTYYSAAGPDCDDFVKVGDHVKKGQVLCIIEAMKLMNEIECEYDGEITSILVTNESMVEYNQPLFEIKPNA